MKCNALLSVDQNWETVAVSLCVIVVSIKSAEIVESLHACVSRLQEKERERERQREREKEKEKDK